MKDPIIRRTKIVDGTDYIRVSMDLPVKGLLSENTELKKLFMDFIDPTTDEVECLERMARFINKFKNKPSKELELR